MRMNGVMELDRRECMAVKHLLFLSPTQFHSLEFSVGAEAGERRRLSIHKGG